VLVADAYYASRKVILPLLADGHHLVTRARTVTVRWTAGFRRRRYMMRSPWRAAEG
jgi:hypothetical protein